MRLHRLHWSLYFLVWVVLIGAAGAALGAAIFPLAGWVFHLDRPIGELARLGADDVGFYFLIWAPATAVVLCVMRAYRRKHPAAR